MSYVFLYLAKEMGTHKLLAWTHDLDAALLFMEQQARWGKRVYVETVTAPHLPTPVGP